MKAEELKNLTDEELSEKRKQAKKNQIIGAVLIGAMVGIAIYGYIRNGFSVFTVFPIIFISLISKSTNDLKIIDQEIKDRNVI